MGVPTDSKHAVFSLSSPAQARESRYGDSMRPLDVDALPLLQEHRSDPLVLRFVELADRTSRAEMVSTPDAWSDEQRAAYELGDWQDFSRLRGYTVQEIGDFADYLVAAAEIERRYGADLAPALAYLVQQQTTCSAAAEQQSADIVRSYGGHHK